MVGQVHVQNQACIPEEVNRCPRGDVYAVMRDGYPDFFFGSWGETREGDTSQGAKVQNITPRDHLLGEYTIKSCEFRP